MFKIAKQGKEIPKSIKCCFHPTTLKVQGLFQDVHSNSSVFPKKIKLKNISGFKNAKQNCKKFYSEPNKNLYFWTPREKKITKFDDFSILQELCDGRTSTCLQRNVLPFLGNDPFIPSCCSFYKPVFDLSTVIYGCCCLALIYW